MTLMQAMAVLGASCCITLASAVALAKSPKPSASSKAVQTEQPALPAQGGKYWSSPKEFPVGYWDFAGTEVSITAGNGLWIWPTEDRPYSTDGSTKGIVFHWRLRPGKTLPTGPFPPQGKVRVSTAKGGGLVAIGALQLEGGPDEGTVKIPVSLEKASGDQALVWVESEPGGKSNLVLIKLGSPTDAPTSVSPSTATPGR